MTRLQSIVAQLPAFDRRSIPEIEQEIYDELEFHLEMRTEENMRLGMPAAEARAAAAKKFGNLQRTRNSCRQALLGERIMLQRLQMLLTVALLVAVAAIGYQSYSSQQANREANLANQAMLSGAVDDLKQLKAARTEELDQVKGQLAAHTALGQSVIPGASPEWAADRPRAVETFPANSAAEVDPATKEIRVTFDKEMADGSWSWVRSSPETFPESAGDVHFLPDAKTCVMPVTLKPGTKYVVWFNTANYQNFKDREGRPAVPALLTFTTRQ